MLLAVGVAACSPRAEQPARVGLFEPTPMAREVLSIVNRARSAPRSCGEQSFAAAAPLSLEARLTAAAQAHSADMEEHTYMSHVGSDGSSFIERAERSGYDWASLAENVAFGFTDAESVVAGWLSSPGHCANIMSDRVTELGVGVAGVYWTQLFGSPR